MRQLYSRVSSSETSVELYRTALRYIRGRPPPLSLDPFAERFPTVASLLNGSVPAVTWWWPSDVEAYERNSEQVSNGEEKNWNEMWYWGLGGGGQGAHPQVDAVCLVSERFILSVPVSVDQDFITVVSLRWEERVQKLWLLYGSGMCD